MLVTFRDLIAANKRSSVLLVLCFVLFVAAVALALGIAVWIDPDTAAALNWQRSLLIGGIAAVVAFLISVWGYYSGDRLVLNMSGAKPIGHADDPELFNVVEEMAIAAGVPMPKVYLITDAAPNAFATGRDPQHAVIAVTTGLREKLKRDELQGVIAHEMSHIRNYDIRLMLLMAVLIGTIVMLSDMFWQMLRFGGGKGSSSGSKDSGKGGGGLVVVLILIIAILLAILAPILATLIQLAVSRQREYLADASAVELTRYPQGLANALRKIDADPAVLHDANRGIAHLFIANPIKKFEDRAATIWASHPPMQDRIARLEALVK